MPAAVVHVPTRTRARLTDCDNLPVATQQGDPVPSRPGACERQGGAVNSDGMCVGWDSWCYVHVCRDSLQDKPDDLTVRVNSPDAGT